MSVLVVLLILKTCYRRTCSQDDRLDFEVKTVENTEKLYEDATRGVAVGQAAHRQRVALISHTYIECRIGVERGGSALRL